MADILQELREPLPKVEGYSGEYVDEDAVSDIFREAADEIERLRDLVTILLENDPYDTIGDGVTVLDLWRRDAKIIVKPKPMNWPSKDALGEKE